MILKTRNLIPVLALLATGQGNRFWKSENQKGEHKKNFLALSLRS